MFLFYRQKKGVLEIPVRLDKGSKQILQHRKLDGSGENYDVDDFQILERSVYEGKIKWSH